jgi:hypothetical protein
MIENTEEKKIEINFIRIKSRFITIAMEHEISMLVLIVPVEFPLG